MNRWVDNACCSRWSVPMLEQMPLEVVARLDNRFTAIFKAPEWSETALVAIVGTVDVAP